MAVIADEDRLSLWPALSTKVLISVSLRWLNTDPNPAADGERRGLSISTSGVASNAVLRRRRWTSH